ncbi:protein CREG1-like [Pleurodeles waltl]|uniref:protein CREG1-like n=1 Tax=Pleurodeles waltl TaxID=8319 RepID=UPI003709A538
MSEETPRTSLYPALTLVWPLFAGLWLCQSLEVAFLSLLLHKQNARVACFMAHRCDPGMLATLYSHKPVKSQPFTNMFLVSNGPLYQESGVPYLCLIAIDISVLDLKVNSAASLAVSLAETHFRKNERYHSQNPLCAHIILSGTIQAVDRTEMDFAVSTLFSQHMQMATFPKDHGWFLAKLNITNIWVLDYFSGMKTVTPEEYYSVKLYGGMLKYAPVYRPLVDLATPEERRVIQTYRLKGLTIMELVTQLEPDLLPVIPLQSLPQYRCCQSSSSLPQGRSR